MKGFNASFVWSAGAKTNRLVKFTNSLKIYFDKSYFIYLKRGKYDTVISLPNLSDGIINLPFISKDTRYGSGYGGIFTRLMWMFFVFLHLLTKKPKFIFCVDFDSILPCVFYKILSPSTILYYDIADTIYTFDNNFKKIFRTLLYNIDLLIIRYFVDILILPDENRIHIFKSIPISKVIIIKNYPSKTDFKNLDFKLKLPFKNNFPTIFYYGSITQERGLRDLSFLVKSSQFNVILAGWGRDLEDFLNTHANFPNFKFIGSLPPYLVLSYLNKCDFSFISYDPYFLHNRVASPNKLFEAQLLNIPVIVAHNTSIDNQIETYPKSSFSYAYGKIEDYLDNIYINNSFTHCNSLSNINHKFTFENNLDYIDRMLSTNFK